jgi:hypothetical protein
VNAPSLRIDFSIAQFTDLHYRNGEAADRETHRVMNHVLEIEKPDMVILTGDILDGGFCRDPIQSITNALQPIIARNLPWAAVLGNHDDEGLADRSQLMAAMQRLPGCLAESGPKNLSGVGNYFLTVAPGASTPILRYTEEPGSAGVRPGSSVYLRTGAEPTFRLFFLDSHAYADRNAKEYAWIKQDQIDWFHSAPHDLPALVFFHIPLPEYDDVWNTGNCTGSKHEPVCCPKFNSGFFNALKSTDDVLGTFVGHDHTNDYIGNLDGIKLCYGRATGFSSYGRAGFPRGARIIRLISGDKAFQTSVRLDGSDDSVDAAV